MATVALRTAGQRLQSEDVTANNTVAAADSGVVLNQKADALVTTLPNLTSAMVGLRVIVRLAGVPVTSGPTGTGNNKSVGHEIAPHSSDKIVGFGVSGTADKSLLMVKASMKVGDYVILVGDGVDTWYVQEVVGSWTFEA